MNADLWSKTSWTKDEVDELIRDRYKVQPQDCPTCGQLFIVKTVPLYLTMDMHYTVDPVSAVINTMACSKA